ncbi:hypothetical protein AMS68_007529 [Peltaster fructicola]|uniref:Cytochrome P450 n=1 Tax=Peltaster fructicola TaxID=286661 RepID=A0A6H0Y4Q6_9PEZI|nr:hypothetical protein AMS68_007529 [Peltaster fructicola]
MDHLLYGRSNVLLVAGGLLSLFVVYQIVTAIHNAFFGPLSKYPGPLIRRFTIIPHALQIAQGEQHRDLERLHTRYGPVIRFGPNHVAFAGNHKTWKEIYGFRKGGVVPKDPMFYGTTVNGVHSIATTMDATNHARQRKIFSNAFSDRALKAQEPLIKTWSVKLAEKLHERAASGEKTDMLKYYNCTTFDIMGDLTFGESLNMLENSEYSHWVKTIFDGVKSASILRSLKFLGPIPAYLVDDVLFRTDMVRERMMEHFSFTAERVDKRLARKTDKPDIWSLLEDKDEEHGGLSLNEHHSNGNVFMIAGTETTATALSGTTYYLLQNPDIMAKLTAEVRSVATSAEDLRLEDLAKMKYLQAVLQEGLRMYPPASIDLPRQVPHGGISIDGNFIPAGTKIGIAQYASYRMPEHFKDANEFHPERWLGDPKYANDNLDSVEPFSVGPRNCLGKNLAWHEMRILLATVLLEFDLTLLPECNDWVDVQKVYTLWDKNPLWCTLTKAQR